MLRLFRRLIIALLMFCPTIIISAQENEARDVTEDGVRIGELIPDLEITSIHHYKTPTARLSDFKGKLLILDFWATWCSPCVAMMPKMEKLQKEFGDKIQFISVTNQKQYDVLQFVSKLGNEYKGAIPIVTDDKQLRRHFPHVYLPHYVWIDRGGKVIAFTDAEQVTAANIAAVLKTSDTAMLKRKRDYRVAYNHREPLFLGGNGGNIPNLMFRSILTGHQTGLSAMSTVQELNDSSVCRITMMNSAIFNLYASAMMGGRLSGKFNYKTMRFRVKDTSALCPTGDMQTWYRRHTYCYELIVPKSQKNEIGKIMTDDLRRMFPQYNVSIEKEVEDVLALVRTDTIDRLKTKGGKQKSEFTGVGFELQNFTFKMIASQLSTIYLQNYPLPIVDDTGYAGLVDIKVDAKLSDVDSLNKALRPYGLAFQKKKKEIEVLVFRDAPGNFL